MKQYDFALKLDRNYNVLSDPAVKIHGALMHSISKEYAQMFHEKKYHPFSIFCIKNPDNIFTVRVSTLTDDGDIIIDAARKLKSIDLIGAAKGQVLKTSDILDLNYKDFSSEINAEKANLIFLTPSLFKVGGKETSFPDISMHFLSVLKKIEYFEGESISLDDFRRALYKCRILSWNLYKAKYKLSGNILEGLKGNVELILPKEKILCDLLKKVFIYSSFSGTGGRTSMGMGGFFCEFI